MKKKIKNLSKNIHRLKILFARFCLPRKTKFFEITYSSY
nr:MAG TPA: hypothetical protein [Caudoviricetes sp.]